MRFCPSEHNKIADLAAAREIQEQLDDPKASFTEEQRESMKMSIRLYKCWADEPETVVVTRHPALVDLLRERGIISGDVPVLSHATKDDVVRRRVIGVLPLNLACYAYEVMEVPLALTPEMRGKELSLEELRGIAGEVTTYTVDEISR